MKPLRAVVVLTMLVTGKLSLAVDSSAITLNDKVSMADAIVVGEVADIERKRLSVSIFPRDSDGKRPQMTTYYDLAVLHPETILKTDGNDIVNKANKDNPKAWMYMAFRSPGQNTFGDSTNPQPQAKQHDKGIWFLRRDAVMTRDYFIVDMEQITDVRLQAIRKLVAIDNRTSARAASVDQLTAGLNRTNVHNFPDFTKTEYELTWRGFDGQDSKKVIYVLDGCDIGRHGEGLASLAAIIDRIPKGSKIVVVAERFRTLETPLTMNPLSISDEFEEIKRRAKIRNIRLVFRDAKLTEKH